jgi:putative nucleotidyltransferase with HDIG domain
MVRKDKDIIDLSKIKMAIQAGIPLSITTYTLPHEMEEYMRSVLSVFLEELNQGQMIEYLSYCLNELITNAKKANTKRIYFQEKKLDITNLSDYEKGMADFKVDTLNNIKYYLQQQKKNGLYVKLVLQTRNNKIKLEVRNNAELTVYEYKRIHDKLSRAQQYTTVDEALNQILDESEGAGLGLIIMVLMLEKIGLTEENYQVLCENGETITRIILPLNEKTQKDISALSLEFVKLIDDLPQFPENIARVNQSLNDPDSKMSEIAALISNDVSLTADLLKLVNSATFALASPCRSIADAVKLVGTRGLKNMLYSIGSIQNLTRDRQSDKKKAMWVHAYQVAFYSYNLARNFCSSDRTVVEDSYVSGLLHDMGKIIFETAHPDLIDRIKNICIKKGIPADIFEKLVAGVNHGEIGALIAEKWNFPEVIIAVIRYHHEPELVLSENKKLTGLVYLSDMLAHYQSHEVDFYQFDTSILSLFHIESELQLEKISAKLASAFEKELTV